MEEIITAQHQLTGHNGPVYAICKGWEPNMILSSAGDKMIGSWNISKGEALKFAVQLPTSAFALNYIHQRKHLITGMFNGDFHVIDVANKQELKHIKFHKKGIYSIHYHPDQNWLYMSTGDGCLSVWDKGYNLVRNVPLGEFKIRSFQFSPDYSLIALGDNEGCLRILETEMLNEMETIKAHEQGVASLCFAPHQKQLITGGKDGHINIYDYSNGLKLIQRLPAHYQTIYSVVFNQSGDLFFTGSRDKTIKVWDVETSSVLQRLERGKTAGHYNSVNALLLEGDQLISASDDKTLRVWSVSAP